MEAGIGQPRGQGQGGLVCEPKGGGGRLSYVAQGPPLNQ